LIKSHRDADAAQALSRLTSLSADDPEVVSELEEIRLNLKHEQELGSGSYLDCFRATDNRILFRTLSGIFIQAWQQLTGINFIFYFGTTFFTNAGIRNPFLISIATSTVNVGMTIPGIWGVEKFGRRRLLLVGAVGMTVCEYIIAIIGSTASKTNQSAQSAEVAFVCFYIAFFASTWGPIAWVITGEIFPLQIRAKAMSLCAASNWLWNWAIAYSSEPLLVLPSSVLAARFLSVFFFFFNSALPGRLWSRKRRPRHQCVLHLGLDVCLLHRLRLLLHSRNQGALSRAGRYAVQERRTHQLGLVPQATARGGYRALGSQGRCPRCPR
jgi:sugar porter (SP) family MFS transporter